MSPSLLYYKIFQDTFSIAISL